MPQHELLACAQCGCFAFSCFEDFAIRVRYEECQSAALDAGYEKIALYALQNDNGVLVPTHAAKQLRDGRWMSKLGGLEDIEHNTVGDVNDRVTEPLLNSCGAPMKRRTEFP